MSHDDEEKKGLQYSTQTAKPPAARPLIQKLPAFGETWMHTKTGKTYLVQGTVYNAITDFLDVRYSPLYPCAYPQFTRQYSGHPKAWDSINEEGDPRYQRVAQL